MLYIAICDDEAFMLDELTHNVHDFFAQKKIESSITQFSSGRELLQCHKPLDLIFLDIQMKEPNGMETAKILRGRGYKGFLIFVTVMEELVFHSFEVQAFDYLVKPIEPKRFGAAMERLVRAVKTGADSKLLVQKGNECSIIPFDDIVYCEIINRKVYLHLADQRVVDYYDKIENLEKKLDGRFFRCHRSYLINMKHLRNYSHGLASLSSGDKIPVSRLRNEAFSNVILQYMKELRY